MISLCLFDIAKNKEGKKAQLLVTRHVRTSYMFKFSLSLYWSLTLLLIFTKLFFSPWGNDMYLAHFQMHLKSTEQRDFIILYWREQEHVQAVLSLRWFNLEFFDFTMVQKWYEFSRNLTSDFEFGSFLHQQYAVRYTLMMLGSGNEPQLPVSHTIKRVNNRYTYDHCTPRQPFCFSLPVEYSMNYMRYSTLYYKVGFVLDDFATCRLM